MFTCRTQIREQGQVKVTLMKASALQLNESFFFFANCQDTRLSLNASPVSLPFSISTLGRSDQTKS